MEFTLSAPKELAERHMSETDIGKYRTEFMRDRDRILYSTEPFVGYLEKLKFFYQE